MKYSKSSCFGTTYQSKLFYELCILISTEWDCSSIFIWNTISTFIQYCSPTEPKIQLFFVLCKQNRTQRGKTLHLCYPTGNQIIWNRTRISLVLIWYSMHNGKPFHRPWSIWLDDLKCSCKHFTPQYSQPIIVNSPLKEISLSINSYPPHLPTLQLTKNNIYLPSNCPLKPPLHSYTICVPTHILKQQYPYGQAVCHLTTPKNMAL